ncbi:uncharacterized protein isoform X1 [Leptinotarsa decemlineata]|uniref:uncharacterized protein isoform X1 n=1 Tax=Leptinotarsa decemlineata TaxID=7539 RepID=UPI003D306404
MSESTPYTQTPILRSARTSITPGLSLRSAGKTRSIILPTNEDDLVEHYIVIPPDGGWGWVIVFIAFICNFLIDGTTYTFGIFLNDISESFEVHPTKVALVNSLMSGFYYVIGPLACALSNRFGFRFVGIIGGIMAAASFIISSLLTDFIYFLIIIGVLAGIGFNMVYTPCMLIVGFYFEKWRALATAISVTGTSIGIMAFPQIFNELLRDYHWRFKFQILTGTCILLALLVITFKPIKPTRVLEEKRVSTSPADNTIAEEDSIGSYYFDQENEPFSIRKIFQQLQNKFFPTVLNYSSETGVSRNMKEDDRSTFLVSIGGDTSEESFTTSVFRSQRESIAPSVRVPEMNEVEEETRECCSCCRKCWQHIFHDKHVNRPLYRDDIFYGASLYNLPEYSRIKSKITLVSNYSIPMSYAMSVSRVVTQRDIEESKKCVCCPEAVVRVLVTMLDVRLFKSIAFAILTLSGFLTMVGLYVPFVFIVQRGLELKLTPEWCTMLLTIMGIANAVGRVTCGAISFFPAINALTVSCVTLIIGGLITMCSALMNNLAGQLIFTIIFGLCVASFTTLRTVVITNMLGLENLTNAFGITIMFYGVASFVGIPLAGFMENISGSYSYSFLFAGCAILISGIILIPVGHISNKEKDKKKPRVQFRV